MNGAGSPIDRLAERPLIVVTGKGGVGKTTVTGLLARAAARRRRKVLALEADPRESLHRLFGVSPSDGATVAAGDGVALHHLRPRVALDELVAWRLGSRWVASRLAESSGYEHFAEGAPGLKELAVFAWILERLRNEDRASERPQTVVLDAPAGGHAAAWLEAPRLVAEAIGSGPVAELARELDAALADGAHTAIVLVTLAEEMPVTESLELAAQLRAHSGRLPDLAVVNGLLPPWPAEGGEANDDPAASMWGAWRRLQQRERARLAEGLPIPCIELPRLAEEAGPGLLAGLAAALESGTGVIPSTGARVDVPDVVAAELVSADPRGATTGFRRAVPRPDTTDGVLPPLLVVVGAGGVGKTTLAASVAAAQARRGDDTLVMTFDPSLRLRQALGLGEEALDAAEVEVPQPGPGRLTASLLDARRTFDGLVGRYAPDAGATQRILANRFYRHLAGTLAGVLEYMAVERLYEAAGGIGSSSIVLDTPPTRQALDFLDAPRRIVSFLDSRALKMGLKDWFDDAGRLRTARRMGALGRRLESYLDDLVGLELLREMAEFFQAFAPLYAGFRERALEVERLLRSPETGFLLVTTGEPARVPDALYFARKLADRGMRLAGVVVNQIHPSAAEGGGGSAPDQRASRVGAHGRALLAWLSDQDRRGLEEMRRLLRDAAPVVEVPLASTPPAALADLTGLGERLLSRLAAREEPLPHVPA
ncbi:MAG: ArsA family ATPase [Thermoanaerobaculia bacterium]